MPNPGSGNRHGKGPAPFAGPVHQGDDGVGVGNYQCAAEAAQAAPDNQLQQALGGGGQQVGYGKNYDAQEEDSDVAELFPETGSQEDGAAQHQQADNHRPGGVIHVHAEVVAHGGGGQSYRKEGELDQQLGGGQGQQSLHALGATAQLTKGADDVHPVKDYGDDAQETPRRPSRPTGSV